MFLEGGGGISIRCSTSEREAPAWIRIEGAGSPRLFKEHRLVYHSTVGWRVIENDNKQGLRA